MKFEIKKSLLLENLNNVIKAISTKNVIPILEGIKFELTDEGLSLTASDSEMIIKAFIKKELLGNVESNGIIIIQSKYIIDIIRKMPSDIINIEVIDGLKIRIYSNTNQFNLNCLNAKEYPNIKIEEHKKPLVIEAKELRDAIDQTVFATSNQESRPLLTGLNLKLMGNTLEFIATDSYRLAKKIILLPTNDNDILNIVVPSRTLIELNKIIENKEKVELHFFNNKIVFKTEDIILQSNLLNGTYPNTTNLIPTDFEIIINLELAKLYDAVDRAALLTQSKEKNIIKMLIDKKTMNINSYDSEIGKVEETIKIEKNNDKTLEIAFSARYMLEALKKIKDKDVMLLLNTDLKPIIIKSVKEENLIQLILPIKTY